MNSKELLKYKITYSNYLKKCYKAYYKMTLNESDPEWIKIPFFFILDSIFSGGNFNHHNEDEIPELTSCAYGASHMALNDSSPDISNGANSRSGIPIFHRNAGSFSSMQPNSSQPQDQYESTSHQHNLGGKLNLGLK